MSVDRLINAEFCQVVSGKPEYEDGVPFVFIFYDFWEATPSWCSMMIIL